MNNYDAIILETERLQLRRHLPEDIEAFCQMEMDADVRRYVGGYPRTLEQAEARFKQGLDAPTNSLTMHATIYKTENKYVGRCGIYPHFNTQGIPIPGEAALGFYIAKAWWGMGIATEAGQAFVAYGFERCNMDKIVTMIQVGNDASVRVIEKLGFVLERLEEGNPRSFYHFVLDKARYYSHLASS
jgi:[ribosomal protein S5]-alanine N-acetyltransferase